MSTRVMATITDTGFRTIKDIGQRMVDLLVTYYTYMDSVRQTFSRRLKGFQF
ncbi:hypothetical protein X777_02596 [Ooceraea biroi]|uniref:Uncharacterized protein n=1 Tax=Ooceraea biroi TaxID=2015173 RepID=A0A026WMT8_OOCBI|nr:hypothetical protein X777_02596 [Ooceraea biroi]